MIPLVESLLGLAASEKNSLRSEDLEQMVNLLKQRYNKISALKIHVVLDY